MGFRRWQDTADSTDYFLCSPGFREEANPCGSSGLLSRSSVSLMMMMFHEGQSAVEIAQFQKDIVWLIIPLTTYFHSYAISY